MMTDWSVIDTPLGKELAFRPPKNSPTFFVPLCASLLTAAICLYVIYSFFDNWLQGGEILAGGVVIVCLMVGGLFLARYWYRHAFRIKRYVLGPSQLQVYSSAEYRNPEQLVDKGDITEILQFYTPPKEVGESGSWKTCVVSKSSTGSKRRELFLEDDAEDVSKWLCATLSDWAGVACRGENTTE